jgi:dinuclear metal center YbgI/SA1388 family protein
MAADNRHLQERCISVRQVLAVMEQLAPPELAEEWDRIGLQIGDLAKPVTKALLALDVTSPVIAEAASLGCQLVISHHPLIFSPLLSLRADDPEQKRVIEMIRAGLDLIVAHTNLDAAQGGVADCLLEAMGFRHEAGTVIAKYGRLARYPSPQHLSVLLPEIRRRLGSAGCRLNLDRDLEIDRVAFFPGSFSEEALAGLGDSKPDLIVCGEIKHHIGLMLACRGIAVIDAGHDVTERVVLPPLAEKLTQLLPQIAFAVSPAMDYNKVAF